MFLISNIIEIERGKTSKFRVWINLGKAEKGPEHGGVLVLFWFFFFSKFSKYLTAMKLHFDFQWIFIFTFQGLLILLLNEKSYEYKW